MSDLPDATLPIQLQAARTRAPVSESLIQGIGGLLNRLLKLGPSIGSYEFSSRDVATFNTLKGGTGTWVLADGQDVTGSKYEQLFGESTVPDFRGLHPRMQDNGRGITPGAPALNSMIADMAGPHVHITNIADNVYTGFFDINGHINPELTISDIALTTDATLANRFRFKKQPINVLANGEAETAVKAGVLNMFIRIN